MSKKAHVIVYSKPGCHLCEEAKEAIASSGCDDKIAVHEVNIETDPELFARYRYDIPVIAINGVDTFMHRVDPAEFRAAIERVSTD